MNNDALGRVAHAASTHAWSVSVNSGPSAIMATRDSGRIGEPWVVMAVPGGRGLKVSFFEPGDALNAEGEHLSDLTGNPRDMGRQLRAILEELAEGRTA